MEGFDVGFDVTVNQIVFCIRQAGHQLGLDFTGNGGNVHIGIYPLPGNTDFPASPVPGGTVFGHQAFFHHPFHQSCDPAFRNSEAFRQFIHPYRFQFVGQKAQKPAFHLSELCTFFLNTAPVMDQAEERFGQSWKIRMFLQ